MVFSELVFLYCFLPATLVLYLILGRLGGKWKMPLCNGLLLAASILFYTWGELAYLPLLLIVIAAAYGFGLLIGRFHKKPVLALGIVGLFLPLLVYKYADFLITNINAAFRLDIPLLYAGLPLGISFYTFQAVSYLADIYTGKTEVQKNPFYLALYVCLFPQLVAGPIVRYEEIEEQLKARPFGMQQISQGMERFAVGLGKKILLADVLGQLCSAYLETAHSSVLFTWMYAIANMLQVYYDFSGYSDMAIGLGRMFGFSFPENFSYPFTSRTITEFWRRWHISLGSWFRDYVYIPMGGNRRGRLRQMFNIAVVWTLTGLWHGAAWNFVLWGAYFGILLILEKTIRARRIKKKEGYVNWLVTSFFVMISFLIFRADSLAQAWLHITGLFYGTFAGKEAQYYLKSFAAVLFLAILGASMLLRGFADKLKKSDSGSRILECLVPLWTALLLVLCTAFIVEGSFQPFFYFRF